MAAIVSFVIGIACSAAQPHQSGTVVDWDRGGSISVKKVETHNALSSAHAGGGRLQL